MRAERPRSLRARVTANAALAVALGVVLAGAGADLLLRSSLRDDTDALLRQRVSAVVEQLEAVPVEQVLEPTGTESGQVQVFNAVGHLLAATPGMTDRPRLDVVAPPPAGSARRTTVRSARIDGIGRAPYRVLAVSVASRRLGLVHLYAASSLDAQRRVVRRLRVAFAVAGPLLVGLGALLLRRVVGRALAPVDAMRAEIDRIETDDLSVRVAGAGAAEELDRLTGTVNRLLDRVQAADTNQRRFAAAASHELRSPATAMRTDLEVALAYPTHTDWTSVAHGCLAELTRLEATITDLRRLTAARGAGVHRREGVDVRALVRDEVVRRAPVPGVAYELDPVDFDDGAAPLTGSVDPDALVQVLRNLFTNAERHATGSIRVGAAPVRHSASGRGTDPVEHVAIRVANDGTPIASDEREAVFAPFTRLDEARSADEGGSGLGLAIARALCEAHGGTLRIERSDEQATVFLADLPLHAPVPALQGVGA